jgi:hypothetical protein
MSRQPKTPPKQKNRFMGSIYAFDTQKHSEKTGDFEEFISY